jgi:putative addiction module component (TIGR02574 family)
VIADVQNLSVEDKLALMAELWESLSERPEDVPVSDAQREELRRRIEEYDANPREGASWEQVKARMKG